jgi:perosamine synthetase
LYDRMSSALADSPTIRIQRVISGAAPAWSAFVCRVAGHDNRRVIKELRTRGIEATIGAHVIHELPYFRSRYSLSPEALGQSHTLGRESIALPFHEGVSDADIATIASALHEVSEP